MATQSPPENSAGTNLPFAALQLLAPPMRLVSAALWKVMKQRDVMHYGTVEEFVTSACETIPGLLTHRHQGKLTLGLRARLILELFCGPDQPDPKVIGPHLERIRAPAPSSSSSARKARKDSKIEYSVRNFHALVETLLSDSAERELFFKGEFVVDYGAQFDTALEKLLWEFLIRIDQLLPVPNLTQTVSWLSAAPPVLEECARAATQPQLLDLLLRHQTCLGHLESAASLPPNLGDSILTSLSLPPSGRVPSNQQSTGSRTSPVEQPITSNPEPEAACTPKRDGTAFINPVIGLICNDDVPAMISANKRRSGDAAQDATNEEVEPKGNSELPVVKVVKVKLRQASREEGEKECEEHAAEVEKEKESSAPKTNGGMKRKQRDETEPLSDVEEEEEEEEEVVRVTRNGRKTISGSGRGRKRAIRLRQSRRVEGAMSGSSTESDGDVLGTCMDQLGLRRLKLPEDPSLCSILTSCLLRQPKVLITRLDLASAGGSGTGGESSRVQPPGEWRKSPEPFRPQSMSDRPQRLELDVPGSEDKENRPVLPGKGSSPFPNAAAPPGDSEDFIGDSEDEGTKDFKDQLFLKRYYKTRHGTYVPTLCEFWKPDRPRRDVSPGTRHK